MGRDEDYDQDLLRYRVSIHAPRVGRDLGDICSRAPDLVSIHAPRVGRDRRCTSRTKKRGTKLIFAKALAARRYQNSFVR